MSEESDKKEAGPEEKTAKKQKKTEAARKPADKKTDRKESDAGGAKKGKKDDKTEKEDAVEIVEEAKAGEYRPKQHPEIDAGQKASLKLRKSMSHARPIFRRQEGHRYKRVGTKWRKPRGSHSKLRRHYKYRSEMVSIGYGSPADTRHLHPSGFREILIHNPAELERIMPETQAARIAHGVGIRKRSEIEKKADTLGIRVLNRS